MPVTTPQETPSPSPSGRRQAFVLMPFHRPYDSYYVPIFRAALEGAGFEVQRADDLFGPRPIMLDIQQAILRSDIVLGEMSGRNPNVFYELGLAHAIGKPAVLVANREDDVPFDLRHVRTIIYDSTEPGWEDQLRTSIAMAAQAAMTSSHPWPPPLTQTFSADPMTISIDVPDMEQPLIVEALPGDHVDVVLDRIYYKLRSRIPGYSYLEKWLLEDKGSGTRLILREIQHYVPASVVFGDDHEWKLVYLTEPYSPTTSSERGKTR
jgi:hypothetical protein